MIISSFDSEFLDFWGREFRIRRNVNIFPSVKNPSSTSAHNISVFHKPVPSSVPGSM